MYKKPVKRLKINFLGCRSCDNQVCSILFAVVRRRVSLFHVVHILKNNEKNYISLDIGSVVTFSWLPASISNRSVHISRASRFASR